MLLVLDYCGFVFELEELEDGGKLFIFFQQREIEMGYLIKSLLKVEE